MGWCHRNMYYLTGLPGWVRFGYSPGWGGLPPGATYLTQGYWPTPQMQAWWDAYSSGQLPFPGYGYAPPTGEQELDWLKKQADALSQQLKTIQDRIAELEKKAK